MKLSQLFHKCAYEISYSQVGDSVNYAFRYNSAEDILYIYFEGSNSISDWIRNFLFAKKPYKDMKIPYKVHRGFLAAWKEVEDIVIEKITEKDTFTGRYKWNHIVVVGYSHGAALAGLCHECVWFYRPDLRENGLEGYGFEAPRFYAGWKVKKTLKERWAKFTIIRNKRDIVTHCPPWLFRYTHVNKVTKIGKGISTKGYKWPKCVGAHYPDKVYQSLLKWEEDQKESE